MPEQTPAKIAETAVYDFMERWCDDMGRLEKVIIQALEAERQRAQEALACVTVLETAIRSLEWQDADADDPEPFCPHCMAYESEGHQPGCKYAEVVATLMQKEPHA